MNMAEAPQKPLPPISWFPSDTLEAPSAADVRVTTKGLAATGRPGPFTLRKTPDNGENMTGKQKLAKLQDKAPTHPGVVTIFGITYDAHPVELLRFPPTAPQDLNGKNGASSVSSNKGASKRSMHTIDFVPALNQFKVVFHGQQDQQLVDMVPMHRVNGWTPFEDGQTYVIPGEG